MLLTLGSQFARVCSVSYRRPVLRRLSNMVIVHPKFTKEVLISAPRRSPAQPSPDGKLGLYSVSTHTIGEDTVKELRVMDLATGESSRLIANDKVHDAHWLGVGKDVVYLQSGDKGATNVVIADVGIAEAEHHVVGEIPAPVKGLKVKALEDGSVAVAVVGLVGDDGEIFNEEKEEKKSTIRVYDDYNVRYWDSYFKPQKYSIWYSSLARSPGGDWELSKLQNALNGTDIEAPAGMYDGVDEGTKNFDIAAKGIVFTAFNPKTRNPLYGRTSNVYFVPLDSFSIASVVGPQKVETAGLGMCSNPRFSPDGSMVAFLRAAVERKQDVRIFLSQLEVLNGMDVFQSVTGTQWHLIPDSFEFAASGHSVLVQAQDCGRVGLYELELKPGAKPETIVRKGAVSAFHHLTEGSQKLLVTTTSLTESSLFQIIDTTGKSKNQIVSSASMDGIKLGLSPKQISEIYFEGDGDYCVQAWVIKPSTFDETKKYPLILMVHGGPESAWNEAWSTRWNPAVWAEQGYIIVCPNITGSTGFGLEHTERIYGSWGGHPYKDLVNCVEYLEKIPYIDLDRAICAGGSYGGYMQSWINGNPLGRKFKALVSHDCVFHLPAMMLQSDDVGYVPFEDFEGPPYIWSNFKSLEKWNPARPDLLRNWTTPMLIIHSDTDYRCPITEGLAAYNTCQGLGTPSRFVNFPDENHFVLKEENSLAWHREVFRWINHWSGVEKDEEYARRLEEGTHY